ncbi:hypothetical protein [Erwinia sp. 9145]|uniref:hypothetical protein n=1 Tax=Erwinia sp. 9145 TaxID=1500895 RepID=UPI00055455DF|nr:hypothetical protein [Erwinia sp. 9145]
MANLLDIKSIIQRTLSTTNDIFSELEYNVRVHELTAEDIDWCIHLSKMLPNEKQLPWDRSGSTLTDDDAFNFSFKITDADNKPAGACISRFCQENDENQAFLNIEMIQNFHIYDSILDGNTLKLALFAAILFMAETNCAGLRLISPLNDEIADYYIDTYAFEDISGNKEILFRDAHSLLAWFASQVTPVADA